MSFKTWLVDQSERADGVGEFSRYAQSLHRWQGLGDNAGHFRHYLRTYEPHNERMRRCFYGANDEYVRTIRDMSKAQHPSFIDWLFSQKERDDPIGDLARDAISDGRENIRGKRWQSLRQRMLAKAACAEACEALREAVREFRAEIGCERDTGDVFREVPSPAR